MYTDYTTCERNKSIGLVVISTGQVYIAIYHLSYNDGRKPVLHLISWMELNHYSINLARAFESKKLFHYI